MRKRARYIHAIICVSFGFGFGSVAGCSSGQAVPGGKRIELSQHDSGVDAGDAGDGDASSRVPPGEIWAPIRHPGEKYPTFSELVEESTGLELSLEEKQIVGTCYQRPWSRNVPDRNCTKDNQCGDGFCDRGHCMAVYTCDQNLGFRCDAPTQCGDLLCIDGRCRSCVSNDECVKKFNNPDKGCEPALVHPPGRHCGNNIPTEEDLKFLCDEGPENTKPPYCKRLRRTPGQTLDAH